MEEEEIVITEKTELTILIVEDNWGLAEHYYDNLKSEIENPLFATSYREAMRIIENSSPDIYWVDIQLGINTQAGISILQKIKSISPNALVIVFTAYEYEEQTCKDVELTNMFFYHKDAARFDDHIEDIKEKIRFFKRERPRTTEYYADIAHIDDQSGWVKLTCYYEGHTIDRTIRKRLINRYIKEDLSVDFCLKVIIKEGEGRLEIIFERVYDIPAHILAARGQDENDDDDESDLLDSEFWTDKL